MLSIKKIKNINLYNLFILVFLISSCSSMNVTEEVVYDGGIRTVEASMQDDTELDYETKAFFTNATVYFEFDKFNLNSKSLQTLKSAVSAMKDNQSIRITIAGHADERDIKTDTKLCKNIYSNEVSFYSEILFIFNYSVLKQ